MRTETLKAYLAGLLDGEGHIAIPLLANQRGTGRHTLDVRITNTNIEVLRQLGYEWGGTIAQVRKQKRPAHWKPSADLRWTTAQAAKMLHEIRPYLRMKAAHADVALALAKTMRPPGHHTKPLTQEEWGQREQLRTQLRTLNQRGQPGQRVLPVKVEQPALTCQFCGVAFDSYQRLRKYCTPRCRQRAAQQARIERTTVTCTCPRCGKEFQTASEDVRGAHRKYCSQQCAWSANPPPSQQGRRRTTTE